MDIEVKCLDSDMKIEVENNNIVSIKEEIDETCFTDILENICRSHEQEPTGPCQTVKEEPQDFPEIVSPDDYIQFNIKNEALDIKTENEK